MTVVSCTVPLPDAQSPFAATKDTAMRIKFLALIALPVVLTISLAGCAKAETSPTANSEKPAAAAAAPTTAPSTDPLHLGNRRDHSTAIGTIGNPAPAGTAVPLTFAGKPMMTVTIGAVTVNAAAEVAKNVSSAPPAATGTQYMLIPVTYDSIASSVAPSDDVQLTSSPP
jgi:hypothetical protein